MAKNDNPVDARREWELEQAQLAADAERRRWQKWLAENPPEPPITTTAPPG